jgi:hypothetical protein
MSTLPNISAEEAGLVTINRALEHAKARGVEVSRRTLQRAAHSHLRGRRVAGRLYLELAALNRYLDGERL